MNKRLQEIRLAILINRMDKRLDDNNFKKAIDILSVLSYTFGEDYLHAFEEFVSKSIHNNFLGVNDEEIVASFVEAGIAPTQMSKDLCMNYQRFIVRFNKYITNPNLVKEVYDKYPDSIFDEKYIILWNVIYSFLINFQFPVGEKYHSLREHKRTLEIEFYLIYSKLVEILTNESLVGKFIFSICNTFNIDFNTINHLKSNLVYITRILPHFTYNNRYLKQEITTLYLNKGVKKGTIGSKIFNKGSNYLYQRDTKVFGNKIKEEDMLWQYIPTIDWTHINANDVIHFIDLFHEFIRFEY